MKHRGPEKQQISLPVLFYVDLGDLRLAFVPAASRTNISSLPALKSVPAIAVTTNLSSMLR